MQIPYVSKWTVGNQRDRTDAEPVQGAIVHSMGEWILPGDGNRIYAPIWLERLGYEVHAMILPNGNVLEWVPPEKIADHAGESKFNDLTSLNRYFLGCEWLVEGEHNYGTFLSAISKPDCFHPDQYVSGGYWYAKMSLLYPNITSATIVAHSRVSGDDVRGEGQGKRDPGAGFDWDRFWYWFHRYHEYLHGR
jgi:N-acetyl-anhydromuramyl-L-alanine amidase AmpD